MKRFLLSMALLLAFCVPWTQQVRADYCTPSYSSCDGNGISNVTFGNYMVVNNNSSKGSSPYFQDFTSKIGAYAAGESCTVAVTYKTSYDYGTIIWVDWDQSGSFEGTEVVYAGQSSSSNPTTLNCTFTIPATAANGDYRMRIMGADSQLDSYTSSIAAAASANPCINSTSYGTSQDFTLRVMDAPSCFNPSGLTASNPTTNSIDLSWTASGEGESGYQFVYVESGDTPDWSDPNFTTSTSYTVSDLYPNTNYDFYVRSYCSETDQSSGVIITARTACAAVLPTSLGTIGFETSEGFTTGSGNLNGNNCWVTGNIGDPTYTYYCPFVYNSSAYAGSNCLKIASYSSANGAYAVLPQLNVTTKSIDKYAITFYVRKESVSSSYSDYNDTLWVGVATDPADPTTFTYVSYALVTTTTYSEYEIPLSSYSGDASYVVLKSNVNPNSSAYSRYGSFYVDNISINLIPTCQPVKTLTATATRTSVTANWTLKPGVTNCVGYEVKLSTSSNPDDAGTTQTISDPATLTYTFEHLDRATTYYVHVRTNCGSTDGYGEWTTTTVTTKDVAPDCTGLPPVELVTGTSANKNVPMYNSYNNSYSQQIFTAAELSALGFEPGYISSIAIQYKLAYAYTKNVTVYMGLTTATTMPSSYLPVKQCSEPVSTLFNTADKWYDFQMTDPLYWDGTSNVVVGMMFNGTSSGSYSDQAFAGGTTSGYMSAYSNTSSGIPSTTSGTTSNQRANMKFQICPPGDPCPAVDTVIISDSTQTQATISWSAATGDYANDYDLYLSRVPVTDLSTVTPQATGLTATTLTVDTLSPYTDYYFYVRVNCNAYGKSDGANWSEGAHLKTLSNCITPSNLAMELRGKTTGMVTWTATTQDNNYRYILSTEPVADPDNTPTTADSIAADSVLLTGLTPATHYYFYLSNECGGTDGYSPYMLLEFTTPDACIAPEDIEITDIQKYQMTLNWTANPLADPTDAFDIIVSTEQVTEFEGVVPTYTGVTGNSKVLDTLQRNTLYYVYLRANCGAGTTTWEEVTATTLDLEPSCVAKQIGTGTSTSTYQIPFSTYYHNSYSQQVYSATELGLEAGAKITSLDFNYFMNSSTTRMITVYLANASSGTSVSTGWYSTGLTEVYSAKATTFSSTNGWYTLPLDNEFVYTGGDIVVAMYMTYNSCETQYNGTYRFYLTSDGTARYANSDTQSATALPLGTNHVPTVGGSSLACRPNIKFTACNEGGPCPALKYGPVIMNVTNNDADFIWRAGTGDFASSYDILLSDTLVTDFEGITPTVSNIPDTFYTFTDVLTPNTHYYSYIRVNCVNEKYDDGSSNWTSPAAEFITELPCLKPTNFVAGDFTSNSVNLSWVEKNQANDWNIIKNTNGDYDTIAVNVSQCTTSGDTIRYTLTGLQAATAYTFRLQANCQEDSLSKMATGAPYIYTLSNATDFDTIVVNSFEVIGDVNIDRENKVITIQARKGSDLTNVAFSEQYAHPACQGFVGEAEFTSPWDFSSDVTVRVFAQDTNFYADWTISMFEEECATPYDFTVTDIQRRSAVLNWNVGDASTSFDLVVSPTELTDPSTGTIENITAENNEGACTYTLTQLDRENTYYVYLRTNCGTSFGQWRGDNFTTPGLSFCDSIEVGDANNQSADIPASFYYKYGTSAQIYTADEIGAAAEISSLAYEFMSNSPMNRNVKIYLVETDKTVFTSTTDWPVVTTNDLVFDGTINWAYGWNKITLSKTFSYSGEHNLMVVYDDNTGGYGSSGQNFRCYNTTSGAAIYCQSDGTNVDPTSTATATGTLLDIKNQIRFGYCVTNDACPDIEAIRTSDVTTDGLTVSWTPTAGDYPGTSEIKYSTTKYDDPETEITAADYTTVDTLQEITGLTAYTRYYIYVRTHCNGEGQEDGWTHWIMTDTITESACEYPRNVVATMTGKTSARLTWTDAVGLTTEEQNYECLCTTSDVQPEPTTTGVSTTLGYADLTGLANSTTYYCYVRKVCGEPDGNSPWIKTTLTTVPAMPAVINLAASNISYNAFTATWESDTALFANETQWEVSVVTTGETPTNWETVDSREYFALRLISETSYDIYVRAKSGSEYSEAEYITVNTKAEPEPCNYIVEKTSAATTTLAPVYSNWGSCYSVAIYTAEELAAKGFTAGTIESISYYQRSCDNTWSATTYQKTTTVWMGNTTKSSFDGNTDWITSGLTEVKSAGVVDFNKVNNEVSIPLDNTFEWDGVSNIAVAVLANSTGDYTGLTFTAATATDYKMIYAYQDPVIVVTGGVPSASNKNTETLRPDIQFCFVQSACAKPNHIVVDQIATTTARVHWYPGSTDIAWEYYVSTEELTDAQLTDLMDNGQTENVMETVVDLEYLTKDMDYYFYLGIECDVPGERTDTLWTRTTFTTLPTCSAPITAQADNTGDNEITFDATFGQYGTVGTYDFRYWTAGSDTTYVNGQTSQIVVNNVPGGDYDWEVRANCSGTEEGSSRWTAGNTVRVCGAYALPYTQGFEDVSTSYYEGMINTICWNDFNASDYYPNYYANTTYKTEGSKSLKLNSSSSTDLYLVMPEMMNAANLRMRFDFAVEDKTRSGDLFIGYMTDNADFSTFVKVDSIPSSSLSSTYTLYPHSSYLHNVPAGAHMAFCYTKKDQNYYGFLDNIVVDTIPLYNVAYTAAPATLGSLAMACAATDTAADGRFYENAKPVFTATPDTGMMLTKWTNANGDSITNVNPWTLTVTADTSIIAKFDTASYNLTVAVAPGYETLGTVEGSGTFKYLSENEFSATAIPHYHVVWNDGSYDAERTITMPAHDTAFTATFAIDTFTVTTTQNVDSMGTITGAGDYTYGEIATITATPAAHHHFVEWSNGEITPQISVEVVKDTTLHATFRLDTVYVTALSNDDNKGQVSGFGYHGYNRPVTLIAHREPHFHVKNWSNGMTGDTIVIYPTGDTTITAYFVIDTFTVSAVANPSATGTFTGTGKYAYGADVAVKAVANEHYHFVNWSNGSTDTTQVFLMPDSNVTLTANFALDSVLIVAVPSEAIRGSVTISAPTSSVTTVTEAGRWVDYGSQVTVEAVPTYPYKFKKWNNDTLSNPYTFTADGPKQLMAMLSYNDFVVAVSSNDELMGIVSGSGTYVYGHVDTLVAYPTPHHHFVGWSNGMATNPYYHVVTNDTTIQANFAIDQFNINAVSNDVALGTVTGGGIYDWNTNVPLKATPAVGCHFVAWSNGATTDSINVNAQSDVTLVATFAKDLHTVSAVANDATRGTVTGSGSYEYGEMVTIQATPSSAHFGFAMWSDGITVNPRSFTIDRDTLFTAVFAGDFHSVKANVNDPAMGTATGGGNVIVHGTAVTLTATANTGYHFVDWSNGATTPSITVNADSNITLTATFAPNQYTVAANVNDMAAGYVEGAGTYNYGDTAMLVAHANDHYVFLQWSNGVVNDTLPINLAGDTTVTAMFGLDGHTVTLNVNDPAMGTVAGADTYEHGTQVAISATANAHYHFVNWSNGLISNPANIVVVDDTTITANFAIDTHTLTLNVNDMAKGEVTGAGTYAYNTPVQITATPAAHCVFVQWSNGLTTPTATVNLTEDSTLTAIFALDEHTVTLNVNDAVMGSVSGAGTYTHGSVAAISATANAHYHFVNWSNGLTAATANIVVDKDSVLTANFAIDQHTVTAISNDAARGTVTGGGTYNYGATASLTANPIAPYHFAGWSNGETTPTINVNVAGDTIIVASFTIDEFYVATAVNDPAMGYTLGDGRFFYADNATVTAVANDHYHFVSWSDGATANPYTFTVSQDSTLTATFAIDQHNVTIGINDPDGGSVTGAGIYNYGDTAVLTATPAEHYHFVGWSNGQTDTVISVTVDGDINITATFEMDAYTVGADITGAGTILGLGKYNYGSEATLIAVPTAGWQFDGWIVGDSAITGDTISLIVTSDTMVYALFSLIPTSVEETETYNYVAYVEYRDIVITGVAEHTVSVFDMNGRLVQVIDNASDIERVTVYASGVYVIRVDNLPVTRVVVK